MLCRALINVMVSYVPEHGLSRIGPDFAEWLICRGAEIAERPGPCFNDSETREDLRYFALGKDDSIHHMLAGGNGYPAETPSCYQFSHRKQALYDGGQTCERRDLRSMTVWQHDLVRALADRKRGRIDG